MAVYRIRGAFRDLNCNGKGPETFRKVWRGGAWQWISGPLPRAAFRASERRAETTGDVETGEIVAEFSRRLPERRCTVDYFYVIADAVDGDAKKHLQTITHQRPNLTKYWAELPGVGTVDLPDPLAH